jgi:hypothetical protein
MAGRLKQRRPKRVESRQGVPENSGRDLKVPAGSRHSQRPAKNAASKSRSWPIRQKVQDYCREWIESTMSVARPFHPFTLRIFIFLSVFAGILAMALSLFVFLHSPYHYPGCEKILEIPNARSCCESLLRTYRILACTGYMMDLVLCLAWFALAYSVWVIVHSLSEGVYLFFTREPFSYSQLRKTDIQPLTRRILSKAVYPMIALLLAALIYVCWPLQINSDLSDCVPRFIWVINLCVPILFFSLNGLYFYSNRREPVISEVRLRYYFFSRYSMRRTVKIAMDPIIYFWLFGWILIPILFAGIETGETFLGNIVSRVFQYGQDWDRFVALFPQYNPTYLSDTMGLPTASQFPSALYSSTVVLQPIKSYLVVFQGGMFYVILLWLACAALFQIGGYAFVHKAWLRTLRAVSLTIVAYAFWEFVLPTFIQSSYFIDPSLSMNKGVFALLLVALFLDTPSELEIDIKE